MGCITGTISAYTGALDKKMVAHVFRRLGFGATDTQIANVLSTYTNNPQGWIDNIVNTALATNILPPGANDLNNFIQIPDNDNDLIYKRNLVLRRWCEAMNSTILPEAFLAKMTLFWSNHLVTGWDNYFCSAAAFMYYKILQQYALTDFKTMVYQMGITPAMLIYLNNNQSSVGDINENYARELMELFTLGVDSNTYAEQDVFEVARALTGWQVTDYCTSSYFTPDRFDNTNKTIFGVTANFNNGGDLLNPTNPPNLNSTNNVVMHIFNTFPTQVANFICTKLYKFFVCNEVNSSIVQAMATTFTSNNFQIAPVLKQLFKSEHFLNINAFGVQIKSPIEFFMGVFHQLKITTSSNLPNINDDFYNLITDDPFNIINPFFYSSWRSQQLLNPPNVAGWKGYRTWINETTLTERWDNLRWAILGRLPDSFIDDTIKPLFINLSSDSIDPLMVTTAVADYFMANGLAPEQEYEIATEVFKAPVPESYFLSNEWRLSDFYDQSALRNQIKDLLLHLLQMPSFQLN